MPAREEAQLAGLLWKAAGKSKRPLTQQEIDRVLEVHRDAETPVVPEQRTEGVGEDWSRIRTDSGDQSWLNHLSEPQC